MAEPTTICGYLLRNMTEAPLASAPAIREKSFGVWQTHDWRSYGQNVKEFAAGIASLGFKRDDKLSVLGNNRPRLYWAQLAAMSLGGQSVPVYHDAIATELAYVLAHAETKIIVAEDQEQVDKIFSIREQLPNLKWLVYDDPRGLTVYEEDILKSYEEVQALGRDYLQQHPRLLEDEVAKCQPDDVALIAYTSGTTGQPKGVMLSHANMVETALVFVRNEDVRRGDDFLAYLPMAWVGESMYGLCVSLIVGCASNCPEEPETVMRDLRELGPTGIVVVPRVWEALLSQLQIRAADSSQLKRAIYEFFRRIAETVEVARAEGRQVSFGRRLLYWLGNLMVYAPIRDQLGLRRARWCYTGGAPMGADTFRFFHGIGINLKQLYGMTEVAGLVTLQPDDQANPETVGLPCPGVEVKISPEHSEVLVRSKGVFKGYYKQEDKTAEALDRDGWFHTGDAGLLNQQGHLIIIDRAKDVGKLSDGTPFAPQFVELKLKFSPYINEAVAFGDGHPFVAAMVAMDFESVGKWAERHGLAYTNYMDLAQKPEVRALIAEEIRRINAGMPEVLQVKRFLVLTKDLDADDNEMTRTRKLRRAYITEKYGPVIEAFYGGGGQVDLQLDVTFEDGSQSKIASHLVIEEAA
jgi:long-chain acyl-CoA synthetase